MTRVLVFGVFDLLHPGHLHFLKQAKKFGRHLTVVITPDARVIEEKGRPPFFNEKDRLELIGALKFVDKAVLGDKKREWKIHKKLKADAVCIGYDQDARFIKRWRLKKMPKIIRIKPWKPGKYSSKKLKKYL